MARAREGFKRLFKGEPEIYRERFIQVTKLAIDEAISAGKSTQARQWLDHLKNELGICSEQLKIVELKLASSLGDQSAQDQLVHFQLISEDEAERIAGADTLVLARANDAAPVCQAIFHLCRSEWSEMRKALQGIGRKSPFAHWRLFLRGCAAYYQNDLHLAQSCFSRLPPNSVPTKKSEAFSNWREREVKNTSESTIKQACQLIGEPDMGAAIIKSHGFWIQHKYFKAYEAMTLSDTQFPEWKMSLSGQLASFFQHPYATMPREHRDLWYDSAAKMLRKRHFQTPRNHYLLANSLIQNSDGEVDDIWDIYRKNRQKVRGANPRFNALCFEQQADLELILDCDCEDCVNFANETATLYLLRAIESDPRYEVAYTKLLDIYQKTGEKSKRNKLLDEMSRRFPESATTLIEAARACLDRKSYVKGLKYLEKARKEDPLNNQIASEIRRGLLGKAIGHYAKGTLPQLEKARATFQELLQEAKNSPVILESRDYYAAHWCALEEVMVSKKVSLKDEKCALAKSLAPHVLEFTIAFYREIYNDSLNQWPPTKPLSLRMKGVRTLDQAIQMLRVFFFEVLHVKTRVRQSWISWLEEYINKALPQLTKSDRETAIGTYFLLEKSSWYWEKLPSRLIKRWLKIDKNDPLFLMMKLKVDHDEPTEKQINQIRDEAKKRGDQLALTAIAEYLKRSEEAHGDEEDDEEDDEDMNDAEAEEMQRILEAMPPKERVGFLISQGLPPEIAKKISDHLEQLPPDQRARPFRDSRPKPKPATRQKPKRAPRPKSKPLTDPNQSEFLF